jgi:hypothetical protein
MAYTITTPLVGAQPIGVTSTTQLHGLGRIVSGNDPTYGDGEFIYLPGAANTAVGSVVTFDTKAGTTTLATHLSRGPVAVAMSANVANQYGWYQIAGAAVVAVAGAVVAGTPAYVTSTAGSLDDAVVSTDKIDGATFTVAASGAGTTVAQIERPSLNGNG